MTRTADPTVRAIEDVRDVLRDVALGVQVAHLAEDATEHPHHPTDLPPTDHHRTDHPPETRS